MTSYTIGLHGLLWHRSRLLYLRETVEGEELVVSMRTNLASRPYDYVPEYDPRLIQLDDLILEVLRLHGEMDTATVARTLVLNRKTAHRRLSGLEWHGLVRVRRVGVRFLWRSVKEEGTR